MGPDGRLGRNLTLVKALALETVPLVVRKVVAPKRPSHPSRVGRLIVERFRPEMGQSPWPRSPLSFRFAP